MAVGDADSGASRTALIAELREEADGWDGTAGQDIADLHRRAADALEVSSAAETPLMLLWTCQACGWHLTVAAPGFAGDGRAHFPDGRTPCGPLTAQRDVRYLAPREADRG